MTDSSEQSLLSFLTVEGDILTSFFASQINFLLIN